MNPVLNASMTFSVASPQVPGTIITLTASGSGGDTPYEYKFYSTYDGGISAWTLLQDWSTDSTFDWETPNENHYWVIQVEVRSSGSTAFYGDAYTNYGYTITDGVSATLITPNPQVAIGTTQTFTWEDSGASAYQLWLGTSVGAVDLGVGYHSQGQLSSTFTGLPSTGQNIYTRLYQFLNLSWVYTDKVFMASGASIIATPSDETTITLPQTITWNNNTGALGYQLRAGSTPIGYDYCLNMYDAGVTTGSISGYPPGVTVYVTLYQNLTSGSWQTNAVSQRTFTSANIPSEIYYKVDNGWHLVEAIYIKDQDTWKTTEISTKIQGTW